METAVNINSDELRKALKVYHKRRGNTDVWLSTRRLKKNGSYISYCLSRGRMGQESLRELCRIIDVDIKEITEAPKAIVDDVVLTPEDVEHIKHSFKSQTQGSYKNDIRQILNAVSEKQKEIVLAELEINKLLCKCWEELKK